MTLQCLIYPIAACSVDSYEDQNKINRNSDQDQNVATDESEDKDQDEENDSSESDEKEEDSDIKVIEIEKGKEEDSSDEQEQEEEDSSDEQEQEEEDSNDEQEQEEEDNELVVQSNFQVFLDDQWQGVCCLAEGQPPTVSEEFCEWQESGRVLDDLTNNLSFDCPENNDLAVDCFCDSLGDGERMHGAPGGPVSASLSLVENGAPIFPDIGRATCSYVDIAGVIKTRLSSVSGNKWDPVSMTWPDPECPHFRLLGQYE